MIELYLKLNKKYTMHTTKNMAKIMEFAHFEDFHLGGYFFFFFTYLALNNLLTEKI